MARNSKFSDGNKKGAIALYRKKGAAAAAEKYGVTEQTIYNWAKTAKQSSGSTARRASRRVATRIEPDPAVQEPRDQVSNVLASEYQRLHAENEILSERLSLTTKLLSTYTG